MKIIYPNNISGISAASEDSEYPATNMLDEKPQKIWKSENEADTITITPISGGKISGVFLGNTNAAYYTLFVRHSSGSPTYEEHSGAISNNQIMVVLDAEYSSGEIIDISVAGGTGYVYAGVCVCGELLSFPDPNYGLKSERVDFSIKNEFSNGGLYVYKRSTPRGYDLSIVLTHSEFAAIDEIYNAIGMAPVPILLSENISQPDYWSGFFHIIEPPSGSYSYPTMVDCSISLREAV